MKFIPSLLLLLVTTTFALDVKSQEITPPPVAPPVEAAQPSDGFAVIVDGKVSIKLVNKTNARIRYQVLEQSARKTLEPQSEFTLKELRLPTSLFFKRRDNGFLKVDIPASKTPGLLEVELNVTTDLGVDRSSLWINSTGEVYLN